MFICIQIKVGVLNVQMCILKKNDLFFFKIVFVLKHYG